MDEARKLLDSLMGTHRNTDRKEAKKRKGNNFKEDNICKLYLAGFCPQYEMLFHSTKRDIGPCHKVHSDAMKEELEQHPDKDKYKEDYDRQLLRCLEDLVRGAEEWAGRERRNIKSENQQMEETGPNALAQTTIKEWKDKAQALLEEAEALAEAGKLEEAKLKQQAAEEAKQKAHEYEEKARTKRTEDVCDVCGSRMESGDAQFAKFRHIDGKIHLGYVRIRECLAEVRQRLRESDAKRESRGGDGDGKGRPKDRSRSRDRDRRRDRDPLGLDRPDEKTGKCEKEKSDRGRDRNREGRRRDVDDAEGRGGEHGRDRRSGRDRETERGRRR